MSWCAKKIKNRAISPFSPFSPQILLLIIGHSCKSVLQIKETKDYLHEMLFKSWRQHCMITCVEILPKWDDYMWPGEHFPERLLMRDLATVLINNSIEDCICEINQPWTLSSGGSGYQTVKHVIQVQINNYFKSRFFISTNLNSLFSCYWCTDKLGLLCHVRPMGLKSCSIFI